MQTVVLFGALALRDALVDLREVNVAPRLLLATVPLRANLIELAVIPLMSLASADMVDPSVLIYPRCQRLNSQIKGERSSGTDRFIRHFRHKGREVVAPRIARDRYLAIMSRRRFREAGHDV